MILTGREKYQIKFLLPITGCLKDLEEAAKIFDKLNIKEEDKDSIEECSIDFSAEEIKFLQEMISVLDRAKQLNRESLSLYHKILNIKE